MTLLGARDINIMLVEDNPGDVRLAEEALKEAEYRGVLHVARDGVEAIEFLGVDGSDSGAFPKVIPDLILLDLNLPRMSGREVLERIKAKESLKAIPVIVLTTSEAEHDILSAYDLHANCYVTKPVDLDQFISVLQSLMNFWCRVVKLPPHRSNGQGPT